MKIFIATSFRIKKIKNSLYAPSAFFSILERYYNVFGSVVLCTRVVNEDKNSNEELLDITHMISELIPLSGMSDIYKKDIRNLVTEKMKDCDLFVGRVPSLIAYKASDIARKLKKPCYAEVVGCAWDAYWNHSLKGKFLAPYVYFKMKSVVKKADYALYVTQKFLQNRYPTKGLSIGVSDVKIPPISEDVITKRLEKVKNSDKNNITLMTSAAINVRYKGQQYVIKAIKALKEEGINVKYYLAGGGDNSYLLNIAKKCGVEDNVIFLGILSHEDVFKKLNEADIYIQPSLTEGLPRALVEALSRGCICIGTNAGGIPELVNKKYLCKRKSINDITKTIISLCEDENLENIAMENFALASTFDESTLNEKRNNFHMQLYNEIINK